MNENTTQRLPQNIARIIKKIKKIKNKQPSPILLAGWLAGWSVGWLARWLVGVSKGILKESYTNPYEVQPAIRIRKESYTIRTDSRLPTGLASLAASLAGVGGGSFLFLIFLIFSIF